VNPFLNSFLSTELCNGYGVGLLEVGTLYITELNSMLQRVKGIFLYGNMLFIVLKSQRLNCQKWQNMLILIILLQNKIIQIRGITALMERVERTRKQQ
jgi:hypothetical protein